MAVRLTILAGLSACAAPLQGTWQGSCDLEGVGGAAIYDILELDIARDGGALVGTASIQPDWFEEPLSGTVSAEAEGKTVSLVANMGDRVAGFVLTLSGTLDGDVVDGDCSTEVEQGNVLEQGTGHIERVDSAGAGG